VGGRDHDAAELLRVCAAGDGRKRMRKLSMQTTASVGLERHAPGDCPFLYGKDAVTIRRVSCRRAHAVPGPSISGAKSCDFADFSRIHTDRVNEAAHSLA